jgi:hypothetical protein
MLAGVSLVNAESENPFLGRWKAEGQVGKKVLEAHLTIDANGGTWRTLAFSKTDGCVGKEVPIKFGAVTPDSMTLILRFSEALHGCTDDTVVLKRIDDKTITGKRGVADLVLTRR